MIQEDQPWKIQEDHSWRILEDEVEDMDTRMTPVKNQQHETEEEDCSTSSKNLRYLSYVFKRYELLLMIIFFSFSLNWKVSGSVMFTQHLSYTSSNKILSYKILHYPLKWQLLERFTPINSNFINLGFKKFNLLSSLWLNYLKCYNRTGCRLEAEHTTPCYLHNALLTKLQMRGKGGLRLFQYSFDGKLPKIVLLLTITIKSFAISKSFLNSITSFAPRSLLSKSWLVKNEATEIVFSRRSQDREIERNTQKEGDRERGI